MVGNAWEFVDEPVQPSPQVLAAFAKSRSLPPVRRRRGIAFAESLSRQPLADEVMYDASTVPARWKNPTVGFRCAKTPAAH